MLHFDHSDRLSLFRLTQELEADQGLVDELDQSRTIDTRFMEAALKVLKAEQPDSTHTHASAIGEVLDHWISNKDLPIYHYGEQVSDPRALLNTPHKLVETSTIVAHDGKPLILKDRLSFDENNFQPFWQSMKALDNEIIICKEDFKALCKRKNLPLPSFWFPSAVRSLPPRIGPEVK